MAFREEEIRGRKIIDLEAEIASNTVFLANYRVQLREATTDAVEDRQMYAELVNTTQNFITAKETRLNTLILQEQRQGE
jgi:hypothetical protein